MLKKSKDEEYIHKIIIGFVYLSRFLDTWNLTCALLVNNNKHSTRRYKDESKRRKSESMKINQLDDSFVQECPYSFHTDSSCTAHIVKVSLGEG